MGASNPHPHCQIWANENLPNEPAKEQQALTNHKASNHSCLLCEYLSLERHHADRVVFENDHFTALVPFWAVWPFETMIIARRHLGAFPDLIDVERDGLSEALKRITARYDNVFSVPFPYSMGFHQRPTDGAAHAEWHFHAHYYPPLLRSATVRKFMVGYEMLGTPQRDITPESAAATLRQMKEEGEPR
jgi:UDPglucose--hexose-1-phosphate uridylyltransferase